MNILEENINILGFWYNLSKDTFNGITRDGNYLVYNDERVDISKFNFHDIMNNNNLITFKLSSLSPEDFFKIIKLHCVLLQSDIKEEKKSEDHNKEVLDIIKKTDPVMKNVMIFERDRDGFKHQYFSVIDESGMPHVFYNDRNVDIMVIYNDLRRTYGDSYRIANLIDCLNQKLYDVKLNSSTNIIGSSKTTEDFGNKINSLNNQYKGNLSYRILGNQEHDIAVVNNPEDLSSNKIITFDRTKDGDLVAQTHTQVEKEKELEQSSEKEEIKDSEKEQEEIRLIPYTDFIDLLNSSAAFSDEQRQQVNLWYATIEDIIMYEDYLCESVVAILRQYKNYLDALEINAEEKPLNEHQLEALNKYREMVLKKNGLVNESPEYKKENVKMLTKRLENDSRAANVNVIQIIWTVIGILTILTAATLYVIS